MYLLIIGYAGTSSSTFRDNNNTDVRKDVVEPLLTTEDRPFIPPDAIVSILRNVDKLYTLDELRLEIENEVSSRFATVAKEKASFLLRM